MAGTSVDLHFEPGDPAHDVLSLFLDGGEHSPTAIAALTGRRPAESTRCAAELVDLGLLDQEQAGHFRPGIALRLNAGESGGNGPGQPDVLSELVAITGGCARIGAMHGAGISYLQAAVVPGPDGRSRRISFGSAGLERAHQSALGQVLLAHASDDVTAELRKQISVPSGSAVTFHSDELEMSMSMVHLSGVAMTRGEPPTLDVAVPVFGPAGEVEIALQISASGFQDADASALDPLRGVAKRLSRSRNKLPS